MFTQTFQNLLRLRLIFFFSSFLIALASMDLAARGIAFLIDFIGLAPADTRLYLIGQQSNISVGDSTTYRILIDM